MIKIPVSIGEVWDKLSILHIKRDRLTNHESRQIVQEEINLLEECLDNCDYRQDKDFKELVKINQKIWDGIAESQKWNAYRPRDINRALDVYANLNNDNNERFFIKKIINQRFNSTIREVKGHIQ